MTAAERVKEALERGERDARLLDGRNFDQRYWQTARQQFSALLRRLEKSERERDAFAAVVGAAEEGTP